MGFEPTTSCLGSKHSTPELRPLGRWSQPWPPAELVYQKDTKGCRVEKLQNASEMSERRIREALKQRPENINKTGRGLAGDPLGSHGLIIWAYVVGPIGSTTNLLDHQKWPHEAFDFGLFRLHLKSG